MTVPVPRYLPRAIREALRRYNDGAASVPVPRYMPRAARVLFGIVNRRLSGEQISDLPEFRFASGFLPPMIADDLDSAIDNATPNGAITINSKPITINGKYITIGV